MIILLHSTALILVFWYGLCADNTATYHCCWAPAWKQDTIPGSRDSWCQHVWNRGVSLEPDDDVLTQASGYVALLAQITWKQELVCCKQGPFAVLRLWETLRNKHVSHGTCCAWRWKSVASFFPTSDVKPFPGRDVGPEHPPARALTCIGLVWHTSLLADDSRDDHTVGLECCAHIKHCWPFFGAGCLKRSSVIVGKKYIYSVGI